MAQDRDKTELIAELARARASMNRSALALRDDLDFATRAKKAFKSSPLPWLGGAAFAGLIIARLAPGRAKAVKPSVRRQEAAEPVMQKAGKAGLLLGAVKMALDFARPAITAWAQQRVADYVAAKQAENDFRR